MDTSSTRKGQFLSLPTNNERCILVSKVLSDEDRDKVRMAAEMGGRGKEHLTVPGVPFSPPPSPSPIKGEGMDEGESFPVIALVTPLIDQVGYEASPAGLV